VRGQKDSIQSWEEIEDKLKEKYLFESYRHCLLDKLHNIRQVVCQFSIT